MPQSRKLRSRAKRQKMSDKEETFYFVDAEQEDSDDGLEVQDKGEEGDDHCDHEDNVEAKNRLDQFIQSGAISLGSSRSTKSPFKKPKPKDSFTIEMNPDLNFSDDVFKCPICQGCFSSSIDQSRHELMEHFAWVFKPLLMHLLDIIEDESYHNCPISSCTLRIHLLKCISSHQTGCPECHFTSDSSDILMEHYKDQHIGKFTQKEEDFDHQITSKSESPYKSPNQSPYSPAGSFMGADDDYMNDAANDVNDNDDDSDDNWWDPLPPAQEEDTAELGLNKDQKTPGDAEKKFLCGECGQKYTTRNHLNRHILSRHPKNNKTIENKEVKPDIFDNQTSDEVKEKKFVCPECGVSYTTLHHLNKHIFNEHPKSEMWDDENQDSQLIALMSQTKNASEKSFVCADCGARYWKRSHLFRHIRERHPEKAEKWDSRKNLYNSSVNLACVQCGCVYSNRFQLNRHVYAKHSNKAKSPVKEKRNEESIRKKSGPLLCVECGTMFSRQETYNNHILAEHTNKLACEKCDFTTGCKEKLKRHLIYWHAKMCEQCGLPIDAVEITGGTQGNRRTRLLNGQPGHVCPAQFGPGNPEGICQLATRKDPCKNLKVDNGYQCSKCDFCSHRSYTLLRHFNLMHDRQTCPVQGCENKLDTRPKLQEHLKQFHPEKCHLCLFEEGVDNEKHDCIRRLTLPGPNDTDSKRSANPMILHITSRARTIGCHICGELLPSDARLVHHGYYYHPTKLKAEGLKRP